MALLTPYLSALAAFFLADMVWLGTRSSRFYKPILGNILLPGPAMLPAVAFYLLYPLGLVLFAINPALRTGNMANAALLGAGFGLFTYGTYDLTNQATLRNWTTGLTLVDMAWGGVLGALTAIFAFWLTRRLAA